MQSVVSHYIPAHNLLNEHKNFFLHLIDCLVIVGFNQNKSKVDKHNVHAMVGGACAILFIICTKFVTLNMLFLVICSDISDPIELVNFALRKASLETGFEYPYHVTL